MLGSVLGSEGPGYRFAVTRDPITTRIISIAGSHGAPVYAENEDSLVYVDSLCEQATREEDNGTEEWSHRYLPFFELRREKKEAEKARAPLAVKNN